MEVSRESLVQNLTGLKSLLRLNADGIGDDEDLATLLSSTRLALDRFEGDLLGNQHIIREDVITPDTLPPSSMTSQRFSLDSLSSTWQSTPNSLLFTSPRDSLSRKFGFMESVKDIQESAEQEEEEEAGQNDVAFQRLSMLLAGLQAQAEAAVGSPAGPLRQFGALKPPAEIKDEEEDEEFGRGATLSSMSPSANPSMATTTSSTIGFNTSCPGTPRLATSFHRSSSSVPLVSLRHSRKNSRIIIDKDGDTFGIPLSPMIPVSTASKSHTFELPPTPPPTLRKRPIGLDLAPPKSGISSSLPSPAVLSRHNSYLVTDTDLETLLSDFLEQTQIRNIEGAYDIMFTRIWAYLFGSGIVWAIVGWLLGWGCSECNCSAVS
ncbi:uncharacterized protein H6S33_005483 [Morchella sextelata]|uniref:uncharacterized protein n=1 Tax=Morchella sextelata TaxID=1174677 RepID=UPI001D038418|nr:uncharacterized protein H6S33_005483 [Morchella sextelata]KAH0613597.1 hypothetical protein H6S33_005483 [Morchella sextelata]